VERVVLIDTPNAGSAEALFDLVQGERMGPLLPSYPPAVIGSFPPCTNSYPVRGTVPLGLACRLDSPIARSRAL